LYDADDILWNAEQVYTNNLNDSSEYINICTYMRPESVQWSYRSQADVSKCWDKRWVVWEAVLSNSEITEIISHCFRSESIYNEMLLEWWRKATLSWKTLSVLFKTSAYRTDSVYTELNNDWTLKKKCNWYSLIMTVLLTQDVTECLYILLKLWQMLYK